MGNPNKTPNLLVHRRLDSRVTDHAPLTMASQPTTVLGDPGGSVTETKGSGAGLSGSEVLGDPGRLGGSPGVV